MSVVAVKVRGANVRRRGSKVSLLIPAGAVLLLLATVPFGGLAGVITTIPTVLVLIALFLPIVAAMARSESDVTVARLIWFGFVAKLVGFVTRYLVTTAAYDRGDFLGYHRAGSTLARSYRSGDFFVPVPGAGRGQGTLALRVITGLIYSVAGTSLLVGALVFSFLSFTGLVLCVKAFRLAVPHGDHDRYARLGLLLPSLLFWPSTISKDAWMLFGLGVVAYGAARVFTRSFGGLALILLGTAASAIVRPHVALMAFAAAALAIVVRRAGQGRRKRMNLVGKVVLLVPLCFAGFLLLSKTQTLLQVDDLSVDSVQTAGAEVGDQTSKGGSAFAPLPVEQPTDLPGAMVTVLFRPFPFEASNALSFGIAAEGSFLFLFTILAWRRILAGLWALPRSPFLAFCCIYALVFVAAFSNIANFGILARERVQVYPFFFAFLAAVPAVAARRAAARQRAAVAVQQDPMRSPLARR